jgi:hypothetical protein
MLEMVDGRERLQQSLLPRFDRAMHGLGFFFFSPSIYSVVLMEQVDQREGLVQEGCRYVAVH